MNKVIKLLLFVLFLAAAPGAFASTYYAKAVAHGQTGRGKVYVSKSQTTPAATDFNYDSELVNSGSGGNSVGKINFYLHAQPEAGFVFRCWSNKADGTGDALSNANPYQIEISSSIKEETGNIPVQTYYAIFDREPAVSVKAEPANLGNPSMSSFENFVGDEITLHGTAAFETYDWTEFIRKYGNVPNKYIRFIRWKNAAGETVSTEQDYTFTITEENKGTYTAEYEVINSIDGNGYYRIWTGADAMVRVAGKVSLRMSSNNVCVLTDVGLVCNPYGSYTSVAKGTNNIYNDPAGIIYISGTTGVSTTAYAAGQNVIADATLSGQGISSKEFFPNNTLNIQWNKNPGYYKFVSSGASLKHLFDSGVAHNTGFGTIKASSNVDGAENQFEINRISRENMDRDRYWFGACPDESMLFDGGYWESMYTAFPYELVEEDGHEAYFVNASRVENGVTVLSLKKIENGIVPANTAVLIKCQAPTDLTEYLKGNGLTPQNRLIPLETTDSRIDPTVADGNLLKGVIQLNTVEIPAGTEVTNDYADEGYTRFDGTTMRIFGVSAEGNVGFYRLAENTVMKSNRVYLDMTLLSPEAQAAPRMRIEVGAFDNSGIAGPEVDTGAEAEYYTIEGIRVEHPVEGRLYIQRRGTSVRKIVY